MIGWTITAECRGLSGVSGGPAIWEADNQEPWLEIFTSRPVANRWIRLTWRSGIYETVCRPVVRCIVDTNTFEDKVKDLFLPAAPFGRSSFIFHVPCGTKRLLISPVDRSGYFRFQLERVERLPIAAIFAKVARRSPGRAAIAYMAWVIGLYAAMRSNLHDGLSEVRISAYKKWKLSRGRLADPAFDGPRPGPSPRLCILVERGHDGATAPHEAISVLQNDIANEATDCVDIVLADGRDTKRFLESLDAADLVVAVPAGTRLQAYALAILRSAAIAHPLINLFYGDDEYIDGSSPTIRPGYDPLLLRSFNYIGPAAVWRVGAARTVSENSGQLLPDPAYAGRGLSLSRFLFRFPQKYEIAMPWAVKSRSEPDDHPQVAILIPTRDRLDLLSACIASILAKSRGRFTIYILDNDSKEDATLDYLKAINEDPRVVVQKVRGPFNFSHICNEGVSRTKEELLIFLNNDTTVIDPDWIVRLADVAQGPDVGAVGAKLLYSDNRVQHAGVIAGLFGRAGHFEFGIAGDDPGFFGRACVPHHVTAVTAACLAITRQKFLAVGGFDEVNLPIELNDIDLCFRLVERGLMTVQLGDCHLYHHESASRGRPGNTGKIYKKERAYFDANWTRILRADPHFSPNLSLYSKEARLG